MHLKTERSKKKLLSVFILAAALLFAALLFTFCYSMDNKYTSSNTDPSKDLVPLTGQWEFYSGRLYTPKDFSAGSAESPEIITIGQFGNFSSHQPSQSPFGAATYRKVLNLPSSKDAWMLEVPEIFSSCRIYVNQTLVRQMGSPDAVPVSRHIQNTLIPLPSGTAELVIQAANDTHYYSGLTYPPVLGTSSAVTNALTQKMIFYALLCFFPLGAAVTSLGVWVRKHSDPVFAAYGLVCLFFSIHVSYPFFHWLGWDLWGTSYLIEDVSYFAMLACMVLLTSRLCRGILPARLHISVYVFTVLMSVSPVIFTYVLFPAFHNIVSIYGTIIYTSKLLISFYLILLSFLGILNDRSSVWLLAGNAVFGFGLFTDLWTGGDYEPLRFGWQDEYSGFLMVLLFMILIIRYNQDLILKNQRLTMHLQAEVDKKTARLSKMLEERKEFLSIAAHDLKAPASAIKTYIDFIREGGINIDEELEQYLEIIDKKSSQIQSDISSLQIFNAEDKIHEPPCLIDCNDFLTYVYMETKPYTDANGIYYNLNLPENHCFIWHQKARLFRAFENIILNATEHTPPEGSLTIDAEYTGQQAVITFTDTGEGISSGDLPHIFDYKFSTKNSPGTRGLGLYFVRISLEEYGGTIKAASKKNRYTVFTVTLPLAEEKME